MDPPERFAAAFSKVRTMLSGISSGDERPLVFLVLSGSFNPVHVQHLRALEIARETMEKRGHAVVGGFLAPSEDGYVSGKLGRMALTFEDRSELCRMASSDSPWIAVAPWADADSHRTTAWLRRTLELDCLEQLQWRSAIGVEVMGSDTAACVLGKILDEWNRHRGAVAQAWYRERIVCCIARPGLDGISAMRRIDEVTRRRAAEVGIEVIVGADEVASSEVSSTAIRRMIALRQWELLRDSGWVAPQVLDRLSALSDQRG